jgi:hypothetical protein
LKAQDPRKDILQKIITSDIFQEKGLYQNLLRYLVESSINDITPKEVTVAHDVFQKDMDYKTSEDATVRVHMHTLRNKLEQYYQTEGVSDDLRLYIPKGHYRVRFIKNASKNIPQKRSVKTVYTVVLSILLLLLVIYSILDKVIDSKQLPGFDMTRSRHALWTHFFRNGYPAFVVIGDFLVFHEYNEKLDRSRRIQDYEINTIDELKGYIKKFPENYPEAWNLGELPHNALYNIIDIMPVFLSFGRDLGIAFSTEIDIHFIKNKNIIYFGEFKNLRALTDLVAALPIRFKTLPWWNGTLTFQKDDSLVTLATSRDWEVSRYVTDLGIIAKLPGHNNEGYLILAGFGYNAQIKIVELISHGESLRELEKRIIKVHGSFPEYFTMVFEVKGFDRASTTAELRFFSALDKENYLAGLRPSN